ncbi:Tubulin-tyrosine ligase family [Legionella busanensis]|uniref:Tubulin-tyrosine ligase family n=1 Tax=Legionella busanensis TaxID=190655 RepID=A0A378JQ47_9GAMM|nr:tubulin-tyrosine ligase [Legionella busanensis]STX52808.1 Tubulin-tyrosine ligase family [Legionella busanensis]
MGLKRNTFYLKKNSSPTYFNLSLYLKELGWRESSWRGLAKFSTDNLAFNEPAAQCLEYKHLLADLVNQHCPGVMPLTYGINDYNWPVILNQIAQKFYFKNNQLLNEVNNLIWILKPALLNNGQSIKLFNKLSDLEQHFLSTNRLGGEHVLQYYISNPQLLRDQRKYSIRQFMVLTNYAGAYLYPHGYFNVARQPYNPNNIVNLNAHLTNEHLYGNDPNVIQIPTDQFTFFPDLYSQIKVILEEVILGLQRNYPNAFKLHKKPTFALFGVDFMVDEQNKVWLLEANHGPCFPSTGDHPLQQYLYQPFWRAIVRNFAVPIGNQPLKHLVETDFFTKLL